jgi:hypothetical protein
MFTLLPAPLSQNPSIIITFCQKKHVYLVAKIVFKGEV